MLEKYSKVKSDLYKNVKDQRKEKTRNILEMEKEFEDMINEENVLYIEECDTSNQSSLENTRRSLKVSEILNRNEKESSEEVFEHVDLDEEQMPKELKKEIESQEKNNDEQENLNNIDTISQFQVGYYVDLSEHGEESSDVSKPTLLQRFKCMTCSKVFPSLTHLNDHWDHCKRTELPKLVSEECLSQVNTKKNLLYNEVTVENSVQKRQVYHRKSKSHECQLCNKTFSRMRVLQKHVFREHEIREKCFACNICPRKFFDKYELKYHMRIHSDEDAFQCKVCSKKFAYPSALRTHEKSHSGEKPYMCDACPKKFAHLFNLEIHKRVHTGEKPYICQYCSHTFTQHSSLRKHLRLHAGRDKLFQCDICRRVYANDTQLKLHHRTHYGELPWKCLNCDHKGFRKPSELSKHLYRFHTENHPFQCNLCEKSFISAHELKAHATVHSSDKLFECTLCGKQYKTVTTLKRHPCKGEDELNVCENLKA